MIGASGIVCPGVLTSEGLMGHRGGWARGDHLHQSLRCSLTDSVPRPRLNPGSHDPNRVVVNGRGRRPSRTAPITPRGAGLYGAA